MPVFLQDLRYSLRMFRKSPGFALVAVLALAFGIGVNSAIFTLLNAIALRPLPVYNPGEVVTVYQIMQGLRNRNVHGSKAYFSYAEYAAYRDQNHVFTGLAAHASSHLALGGAGARRLTGFIVSCNYFSLLAPSLHMGRGFLPSECGAQGSAPVVVLSHRLWKGQYASDPQILGKTIVLNRGNFTVVGVAPEGFVGASILGADVWAPFSVHEQWNQGKNYFPDANMSWLEVAGRLKPGVSLANARADLAVIAAGVDRQNPGRKTTLLVDTATFMNNPEGRGPVLGVGAMILAAVSLVLVIACANLANLLLARAVGRKKEIAVRLAVGASRWRLLRQLLTESLLLSTAGGVLGLLAAWATIRTMVPLLMARLPQEVQSITLNPDPDIRIVLYSLVLALRHRNRLRLASRAPGLQPRPQLRTERVRHLHRRPLRRMAPQFARHRANRRLPRPPDRRRTPRPRTAIRPSHRSRIRNPRHRHRRLRSQPRRLRRTKGRRISPPACRPLDRPPRHHATSRLSIPSP